MPTSFYDQPEEHPHSPYAVALAVVAVLGDQWGALPGPWGTTGHLHDADRIPFTIGVCEAGSLYIRNDTRGDGAHVPVKSDADLNTIGEAIAELIGRLY
ncbi:MULTISPECIES: hypothetical protein [Streptomyces]|uniref:hypothetical protein n=1 Tax=Streptomyces TaxID=1883 RepID=UPI00292E945D|nr:hypothetical protein [Streptomyces sp. NEAU-HV9]